MSSNNVNRGSEPIAAKQLKQEASQGTGAVQARAEDQTSKNEGAAAVKK